MAWSQTRFRPPSPGLKPVEHCMRLHLPGSRRSRLLKTNGWDDVSRGEALPSAVMKHSQRVDLAGSSGSGSHTGRPCRMQTILLAKFRMQNVNAFSCRRQAGRGKSTSRLALLACACLPPCLLRSSHCLPSALARQATS
eukprot:scaffold4477_cov265-Pinguiococcus_pyrenoidosus.AAC.3